MKKNQEIVNTSNFTTKYGIIAGLSISAILFLFQLAGNDFAPALKLGALLPLAFILLLLFRTVKRNGMDIFPSGLGMGLKLSLLAAVTVVTVNFLIYMLNSDVSFSKYSILPETGENFLMISVILLFEIFVFGGLISFIFMQFYKNSKSD